MVMVLTKIRSNAFRLSRRLITPTARGRGVFFLRSAVLLGSKTICVGGNEPMLVDVRIEIPEGSANKYEWDAANGCVRLDRVLYGAMHYPINYGLVPNTWADDEDPLDALVFGTHPFYPGVLVTIRVIGSLSMTDEHGPDDKLVGVVARDPRWDHVRQLSAIAPHRLTEIHQFFRDYKSLQGLQTNVGDWGDEHAGIKLVQRCQSQYLDRVKSAHEGETPS